MWTAFTFLLAACGQGPERAEAVHKQLSGVASSDKQLSGVVSLKDSSSPAQEKTVTITRKGAFSIDVEGLTPPYTLKADLAPGQTNSSGNSTLHSVSDGGTANINPLTDALVAGAAGEDPAVVYEEAPVAKRKETADNLTTLSDELRVALAPLLDQYQVSDPQAGQTADSGMNALLRDVSISVYSGIVYVVNKATAGLIYKGPASDPASGTFNAANMPPAPTSLKVAQPDPVVSSPEPAPTPTPTATPTVTPDPIATATPAPAPAPTPTATPTPTACSYTYSTWSACQSNNTQTRSVLVQSPSGCVGTPVVTQACTYVPPAPVACTYTYSAWSTCQSNSTQTRTVTGSAPVGCSGTPAIVQACTYVPPAPTPTPTPTPTPITTPISTTTQVLYPPLTSLVPGTQPSMSEPSLGSTQRFSDLTTSVTRASDSRHHYSKTSVWNSDESRALTDDGKVLDGTTYALIRTVTLPNEHKTWSNTDPRYVYGANKAQRQWVRLDVTTGTTTVLATYSQYSSVSYGMYEGNMDNADTGAVLVGDGTKPFVIDPKTGAVRCTMTSGGGYGGTVSDATMSQDGKSFLVNWVGRGVDAYDAATCAFRRQIAARTSHYDACVSTAGDQVYVNEAGQMVRLSDGAATQAWNDGSRAHVSCRNLKRPGWIYVSVENTTCDSTLNSMKKLHRVFAVKLDGSQQIEDYAWDHQACPSTYDTVPMAVPSRLGNRVWFKGNWDGASSLHSFVAQRQ